MSPRYLRVVRSSTAWIIALALMLQPDSAMAKPPVAVDRTSDGPARPHRVGDVALQRGGLLQGQVVSSAGVGIAESNVELTVGPQHWQTKSDSEGRFQLTGLRGGIYQCRVAGQLLLLRAWAEGTAPPHASQGLLVTRSNDVIRGQRTVSPNTNQFFRVAKQRLANPWVVGGIVVTAVTIPVAIHNADDDDPPATP